MKVLVINCGSQSVKFKLIDSETEKSLAGGQIERIGLDGILTYKKNGTKTETDVKAPDHVAALKIILSALTDEKNGVIKSLKEIDAVGHRASHGSTYFNKPTILNDDVIEKIKSITDLAPLHTPANIIGFNACMTVMPDVPQVAVFDNAFHHTIPPKAYLYAVPKEWYEKYAVRRYGFHGSSHSYVSQRLAQVAGLDINNSRLIICHIGSGASICAVKNGESVDTSMGMTPLEGLPMGTRSGSIDPAIVEYMCKKENKTVSDITMDLNKKSGVKGMSGLSNDFRDLLKAEKEGNMDAKHALDVLIYSISKYVGAYFMALGGVDAIALTGGAGENNLTLRARMVESFKALSVKMNYANNTIPGREIKLSTDDSKVQVWTIPTDEELKIARDTVAAIRDTQ
ncbi:MAG: acetate kinase [Lachnospiraceae bacterium]|jgi:acetate kinase|nr:acetate kinase [Lachnospiraceae bacterium]MEE3461509.1 acetate kinase [Lachnospiraceae bacterium]